MVLWKIYVWSQKNGSVRLRMMSSLWDLLLLLWDSNTLWMREGKRGGLRSSPGGRCSSGTFHLHLCLSKTFWNGPAQEVVSSQWRDVDYVSFLWPSSRHPLPVLSGIPTLLKAQLLFQWVFSCWDGTLHWAIHSPMGWFATAEQKSHRNLPLSYASSFDMGRIWWPLTEMFPWGHLKAGAKGTHTCVFISGERRFSLC